MSEMQVKIYKVLGKHPDAYDEVSYVINGKQYKEKLLSSVLKEIYKSKGYHVEVVELMPMSYPQYLSEARFKPLISMGIYNLPSSDEAKENLSRVLGKNIPEGKFRKIRFDTQVPLLSQIFLNYFVKDILQGIDIVADISTALNVYIYAITDALKRAHSFNFLYSKSKSVEIKIAYSDPVIPRGDKETPVHAFEESLSFSYHWPRFPLLYDEIEEISKKFSKIFDPSYLETLKDYLEESFYVYQAIRLNIPLYIAITNWKSSNEISQFIEQFVDKVEEVIWNSLEIDNEGDTLIIKSSLTSSPDVLVYIQKIIHALFIYAGLSRRFVNHKIPRNKRCLMLSDLERFYGLFEELDLTVNRAVLENEVRNNGGYKDYIMETESPKTISFLKARKNNKRPFNCSQHFNERDFYAHAGFEWCNTLLFKKCGEIYIKYKTDFVEQHLKRLLRVERRTGGSKR